MFWHSGPNVDKLRAEYNVAGLADACVTAKPEVKEKIVGALKEIMESEGNRSSGGWNSDAAKALIRIGHRQVVLDYYNRFLEDTTGERNGFFYGDVQQILGESAVQSGDLKLVKHLLLTGWFESGEILELFKPALKGGLQLLEQAGSEEDLIDIYLGAYSNRVREEAIRSLGRVGGQPSLQVLTLVSEHGIAGALDRLNRPEDRKRFYSRYRSYEEGKPKQDRQLLTLHEEQHRRGARHLVQELARRLGVK
jgi:hypothetical protein